MFSTSWCFASALVAPSLWSESHSDRASVLNRDLFFSIHDLPAAWDFLLNVSMRALISARRRRVVFFSARIVLICSLRCCDTGSVRVESWELSLAELSVEVCQSLEGLRSGECWLETVRTSGLRLCKCLSVMAR